MRPVVRYYGGKWKLAKWIISYFPDHRIYTEPFGGAASVLLQKSRSYAEVYNDMNGEIVNVFRVLRNPAQAKVLQKQIELTPFAREEFELAYLPDSDPIEQARRTIARTFMGFGSIGFNPDKNTGFRANSNRSGTIPSHDWQHYPSVISEFITRLQGVIVENRPAIEIIRQHDGPKTLHYIDPPYEHDTKQQKERNNYLFEMTNEDHIELCNVLMQCKGMVIISGYRSNLYDQIYVTWKRIDKATYADGARKRTESLWLSPSVEKLMQQKELFTEEK